VSRYISVSAGAIGVAGGPVTAGEETQKSAE
jgi:hypothetical protein